MFDSIKWINIYIDFIKKSWNGAKIKTFFS